MIRIGIIPKVLETYKNQFELSVERNLLNLIKNKLKFNNVDILDHNSKISKYNVFISSGGNNIKKFSKNPKDKLRNYFELQIIKHCVKNNSTYVGVCYGAQFIADLYGSSLNKNNFKNKKKHLIKFVKNFGFVKKNKITMVNSFHNYKIDKLNKNLITYAKTEDDNSVEFFKHKDKKIYGIMWHPERLKKINIFHKKLLKNILCS